MKLPDRDHCPLSSHLVYDSYDPEGRVFVNRDGSLGIAWSLRMADTEVMGEEELQMLCARFEDSFRHLPTGSAAQFLLMADRDVRETLSEWENASPRHPALGPLFDGHLELLRNLELEKDGYHFQARTLRLFFTLRVFPDLGSDETSIARNYPLERARLLETASSVENFFAHLTLSPKRLSAEEFVGLVYRILNPARAKSTGPRKYRDDLPIRDQVVRSAARADFSTGVVTIDGTSMQVISMLEKPEETYAGAVTRPHKIGAGILDLIPEATLVYQIEILDDYQKRKEIERRKNYAWNQLRNGKAKADIVKIKEDAEGALHELLEGRRPLGFRFHIVISDSDKATLRRKTLDAVSALDRIGIETVIEDWLAMSIYLHSLPLQYDPACDRGMNRSRLILSDRLACLLPVYGTWRGTPSQDVLLQNRRGEPVTFSLFDSSVAYHAIVTGVSGAGKSFFMNYLVACMLRRKGQVWILDKGGSYKKLCELVGGEYIVFDTDRPRCINPCGDAESLTNDRTEALAGLIATMCSQGRRELCVEETSLIMAAIPAAYEKKGKGEVFLSDIHRALLEEGSRREGESARMTQRLALSMEPFVGKGPYAGFFDGPSEISLSASMVVFEFAHIFSKKEVASPLLLALLKRISDFSSAPRNLHIKKLLAVDEAWALLKTEAAARFLEEALRTYRKYNCAAVMVTQQIEDFTGAAAKAIKDNSPNRIFLKQTADTIQAMSSILNLQPVDEETLLTVKIEKGKFSEAYIVTDSSRGTIRLVPDDYFYWLATSDGGDNAHLYDLMERARSEGAQRPLLAAIEAAAKERHEASLNKEAA